MAKTQEDLSPEMTAVIMDLLRPQASRPSLISNGIYTLPEALKYCRKPDNLSEIPEPQVCEYCGSVREYRCPVVGGRIRAILPPEPCSCTKAVEERNYKAQEEKRLQAEYERNRAMQEMKEKIKKLLSDSGIKERFKQRTFEAFIATTEQEKRAKAVAQRYAENFLTTVAQKGSCLRFEGTKGTGKTHLAAAIALELISKGVPVIFKSVSDLLLDIRKTYSKGEKTEEEILDVYKKVDLLVIDDIDKAKYTEWGVSVLYQIINDRYENMKPMVVTANNGNDDLVRIMTPPQGISDVAESIVSRLCEDFTVIMLTGKDKRKERN